MKQINITELRQHLPNYLASVQKGAEIWVTSHGRVIAHITPPGEPKKDAQKKLEALRKNSIIGDIISPIDEEWSADQ